MLYASLISIRLSRTLFLLRVLLILSLLRGRGTRRTSFSHLALSLSLVERFMLLFMLFIQNTDFFVSLLTGKWQPIYFSVRSGCVEKGNAEFFFVFLLLAGVAFDLFVCLRQAVVVVRRI